MRNTKSLASDVLFITLIVPAASELKVIPLVEIRCSVGTANSPFTKNLVSSVIPLALSFAVPIRMRLLPVISMTGVLLNTSEIVLSAIISSTFSCVRPVSPAVLYTWKNVARQHFLFDLDQRILLKYRRYL